MSDTPRTEAETFCWGCQYNDSGHEHDNVVSDKFAQGLERELAASQAECAELHKDRDAAMRDQVSNNMTVLRWQESYAEVAAERDELRRFWFEDAQPVETRFAAEYLEWRDARLEALGEEP